MENPVAPLIGVSRSGGQATLPSAVRRHPPLFVRWMNCTLPYICTRVQVNLQGVQSLGPPVEAGALETRGSRTRICARARLIRPIFGGQLPFLLLWNGTGRTSLLNAGSGRSSCQPYFSEISSHPGSPELCVSLLMSIALNCRQCYTGLSLVKAV